MTKQVGVSPATVQRIWSGRGLKPHLVKTFKLSNDPLFEEKLIDVVGLYLNPPEQAVVLCMDEKTSIQALDHTQASLPMTKGRAGTVTSDYKRHGTTTLFAALNALDGTVIGSCMDKHRQEEFLKFLRTVNREVPKGLAVHMILDNYATHKHQDVVAWLAGYFAHGCRWAGWVWPGVAQQLGQRRRGESSASSNACRDRAWSSVTSWWSRRALSNQSW
jgi:DDE superfamily endonuclease